MGEKTKEEGTMENKEKQEVTEEKDLEQVNGGLIRKIIPDEEEPVRETQRRCPTCGKYYAGVHHCVIT